MAPLWKPYRRPLPAPNPGGYAQFAAGLSPVTPAVPPAVQPPHHRPSSVGPVMRHPYRTDAQIEELTRRLHRLEWCAAIVGVILLFVVGTFGLAVAREWLP